MTDIEKQVTFEDDDAQGNDIDAAFHAAYKKALKDGTAFNLEALENGEKPVFITDDIENVLLFRYLGYEAAAINGTENALTVLKAVRKAAPRLQGLIVSLPPEYEEAKEDLRRVIEEKKITGCITQEAIDPTTDPDAIQRAICAFYGNFFRYSVANMYEAFMNEATITNATPPTKTGFANLDNALAGGRKEGGLFPELYTVGGGPGTGKTAFVMQIADYIAGNGRPVLVYALEMGANQLEARSISRITAEITKAPETQAATAMEILYPEGETYTDKETGVTCRNWKKEKAATIMAACQKYFTGTAAGNLHIIESMGGITAQQIKRDVGNFIAGHPGDLPPVVIVDYLQILAPIDPRATDKQNADKAIQALKDIVKLYHTPVISIISWNRGSYDTEGELSAGKESGGLEYTAGTVISLQYEVIIEALKKDGKTEQAKALKAAKELLEGEGGNSPVIVASIKKNRFAKNEIRLRFFFEKAFSRYLPAENKLTKSIYSKLFDED